MDMQRGAAVVRAMAGAAEGDPKAQWVARQQKKGGPAARRLLAVGCPASHAMHNGRCSAPGGAVSRRHGLAPCYCGRRSVVDDEAAQSEGLSDVLV